MQTLQILISSKAFLVAVWALAAAILTWAAPDMPREIRGAIDALVAVIITTVAVNDSHQTSKAINESIETDVLEALGSDETSEIGER